MRRVWVTSEAYQAAVKTLVEARTAQGISQRRLAEILGKPRSFVSKYQNRERRLDIVEFIVIAKAIGISPAALTTRVADALPADIKI